MRRGHHIYVLELLILVADFYGKLFGDEGADDAFEVNQLRGHGSNDHNEYH